MIAVGRPGACWRSGQDLPVSRPAAAGALLMAVKIELLPRLDLGRVAVDRLKGASDAAGVHRSQVMAIDGLEGEPARVPTRKALGWAARL